jgi:hypothetical protein
MTGGSIFRFRKTWLPGIALVLLFSSSGCQTFHMSEAEFSQQQLGHYDNSVAAFGVEAGAFMLDMSAPDSWRAPDER